MRRFAIALFAAVMAAMFLPSMPGSLSKLLSLNVRLVSDHGPLTFGVAITDAVLCDVGTLDVTSVQVNGTSVTPISVAETAGDPNGAHVVLPSNTPAGLVEVMAQCTNEEESAAYTALGEVYDFELFFGADGGTQRLYFDSQDECNIRETYNGGATSTTISLEQVVITDPVTYSVTVTNTFAAAIQPAFTG